MKITDALLNILFPESEIAALLMCWLITGATVGVVLLVILACLRSWGAL